MSKSKLIKPPNWTIKLFEWFCPIQLQEGILGDLLEQFDNEVAKKGALRAKLSFLVTTIGLFHPVILFKNRKTMKVLNFGLFKNHLTVVRRSMMKQKFYSLLNILGLALAVAFVFLVYLFIKSETSIDDFHKNKSKIYRLYEYKYDQDTGIEMVGSASAVTAVPLAPRIANEIPGINRYTRFGSSSGTVNIDNVLFEETICMVDPSFLKIFSYPLISGNLEALKDPNSLILSRDKAELYFKDLDPIGREIDIVLKDSTKTFIVSGVVDNRENVSSIKFDLLVPFERMEMISSKESLESYEIRFIESWVEFDRPVNSNMTEALTAAVIEHIEPGRRNRMVDIQPLTEVYFDTDIVGLANYSNPQRLWVLIGLSGLTLLIAIINFITLSTGHSMQRVKEIGLRKSLGAAESSLRVQLVFESFTIVFFASMIGAIIGFFLLPTFNSLFGATIVWRFTVIHVLFILTMSLCISLIAGLVQASILIRIKSLNGSKEVVVFSSKESWLNQGLVILQFAISFILIIGTLVMRDQMGFIHSKELGFNKEQLIEIELGASENNEAAKLLVKRFKTEASSNPNIKTIGASMNSFKEPWTKLFFDQLDGPPEGLYFNKVDIDYLKTMQIELMEGEGFTGGENSNAEIIINEALLKHFEWDSPFEKQIPGKNFSRNHRIVGVVKDFHFSSLHSKIEPILLVMEQRAISSGVTGISTYQWPPNFYRILVRIGSHNISESISFLEASWKKVNPSKPFAYHFVDEVIANNYAEENKWQQLINYASIFAILIAWMGLLGLTRLSVKKRTKEIGIRKVLGSSATNVTKTLSLRFMLLVLVSFLIACPIAWLGMGRWLESFSYRIDLSVLTFISAGVLVLLVALISVGMQSYKAAIANPVDSLKCE